jgi:hypothetical protein
VSDEIGAIELLSAKLIETGFARKREFVGCSDSEICELERFFGLILPQTYWAFLKTMGKGMGTFMRGTDVSYRSLFDNRAAMEEVLSLDGQPFALPHSTFVFSSHQGYIFHFFDTASGDDNPPVHGYREGELKIKRIDDSLSDFFLTALEEEKQIRDGLSPWARSL